MNDKIDKLLKQAEYFNSRLKSTFAIEPLIEAVKILNKKVEELSKETE